MMETFRRQFLVALSSLLIVTFAVLIIWTHVTERFLPAKPAFPIPGKSFVAEYSGVGADVAHMLYYWGLFGFSDSIKRANVLLLGSSHTQFGLSAREISSALSGASHDPQTAFNLGLGCGETLRFDMDLLDRLALRNRTAIMDTYTYGAAQLTPCSVAAESSDAVRATFAVLDIWSRFGRDWFLDGSLPLVSIRESHFAVERFLNAPAVLVDWRFGDVQTFYRPDSGEVFPSSQRGVVDVLSRTGLQWDLRRGSLPVPDWMQRVLVDQKIDTIFTMIPYAESPHDPVERQREIAQYEAIQHLLEGHATNAPAPFVPISARRLTSFDYGHLTGDARSIASKRLVVELEQDGLLLHTSRR